MTVRDAFAGVPVAGILVTNQATGESQLSSCQGNAFTISAPGATDLYRTNTLGSTGNCDSSRFAQWGYVTNVPISPAGGPIFVAGVMFTDQVLLRNLANTTNLSGLTITNVTTGETEVSGCASVHFYHSGPNLSNNQYTVTAGTALDCTPLTHTHYLTNTVNSHGNIVISLTPG